MFDRIIQHVQREINLTTDEVTYFTTLLTLKKLRRRQPLLRAGEPCDFIAYVNRGLLRSFTTDAAGAEHVLHLTPEDFWIDDLNSLLSREPSEFTIEALEDSEVVLISAQNLDLLYDRLPAFERFFRLLNQNSYIRTQKRLLCAKDWPAADRYQELMRQMPTIEQRVVQHQIASFLGITPESLSRLKKGLYEQQHT